jgi:hypothetical protein
MTNATLKGTMNTATGAMGLNAAGRFLLSGPHLALQASLLTALAAAVLLPGVLSPDAVLPAITTALFLMAGLVAGLAWLRGGGRPHGLTYWDASGLLTVVGICIAAAVEPEQLVRLFAVRDGGE